MAAQGLGQRLRRAQQAEAELREATVVDEDLPNMRMDFGKHKGKTFAEVAESDMQYLAWCADHLADSDKPNQKFLLRYINNLVEDAEADAGIGGPAEPDAEADTQSGTASQDGVAALAKRVDGMEKMLWDLSEKLKRMESLLAHFLARQQQPQK